MSGAPADRAIKTENDQGVLMTTQRIASIALLLGLAGCAAYGGATLLSVPMELSFPRGVALRSPDAIQTKTGTRFHGSVCRRSPTLSPTRIRIERIDGAGTVVASASRTLSGMGGRGGGCTFYDVPTDWTVGAGERVRVCALRSEAACPTARPLS